MFLARLTRIVFSISLVLLVVSLNSCTYDVETPNVCFQEDVLPIFASKCATSACHDPITKEEKYDLSNYEGIMKGIVAKKPLKSELYTEIASGEMPPSSHPSISQLERTIIKNWIRSGAPNSSNCNTCDTTYKFSSRIKPLIDKWCYGCHNPGNAGGGYDLSTHAGIVNSAQNNRLLGSLKQTGGFSNMPKNAGKLSTCDITAIEKWINAGMNND